MKRDSGESTGIQLLIEKYRQAFRIPENLNHYSEKDYQEAEKAFLKYAILNGNVDVR